MLRPAWEPTAGTLAPKAVVGCTGGVLSGVPGLDPNSDKSLRSWTLTTEMAPEDSHVRASFMRCAGAMAPGPRPGAAPIVALDADGFMRRWLPRPVPGNPGWLRVRRRRRFCRNACCASARRCAACQVCSSPCAAFRLRNERLKCERSDRPCSWPPATPAEGQCTHRTASG